MMEFFRKKGEQLCARNGAYSICWSSDKSPVYVCYYHKEIIGGGITDKQQAKGICENHQKGATNDL